MATTTVGAGKDFETLAAWETTQGAIGGNQTALCTGSVGQVTINAWGVSTGEIIIKPDVGQKHDGVDVQSGAFSDTILLEDNTDIVFEVLGMGISYTNTLANGIEQEVNASGDTFVVDKCLIVWEPSSGVTSDLACIRAGDFTALGDLIILSNNIIRINDTTAASTAGLQCIKMNDSNGSLDAFVQNNTLDHNSDSTSVNSRLLFMLNTDDTTNIENNCAFIRDAANSCYSISGTPNSFINNVASDTSLSDPAEGTNSVVATDAFVGFNDTVPNYKVKRDGPLHNTGTTPTGIGGNAELNFDIVDIPRPQQATFDIGAYELTGGVSYTDRNRTVKGVRAPGLVGRGVPFDRS